MQKLAANGAPGKGLDALSDPEFCLFVARGDERAAKLIQCAARRQVRGYWWLADSLKGWANDSGLTFKQTRVAVSLAKQLDFVDAHVERDDRATKLCFRLLPRALPAVADGPIDWKAIKRAAPKKTPKKEAQAVPAPLPAPPPVPVEVAKPVEVPKADLLPKHRIAFKPSFLPNKNVVPCMIDGPPADFVPWGDPAKAARRMNFNSRKKALIAILADDPEAAAYWLQQLYGFSRSMREGLRYCDLWVLNQATYEDHEVEQRMAAGKLYLERPHWWSDRSTPGTLAEVMDMKRAIETVQRFRWRLAKADVKAKIRASVKEHGFPMLPGWKKLLDRLKWCAWDAGYHDTFCN